VQRPPSRTDAFNFLVPRDAHGGAGRPDPRLNLFVKFEKAATSAYAELGISDAAAFGMITQPTGGLAIRVHVLPAGTLLPATPQPNAITARQPALLVREVRGAPSASCPVSSALGATTASPAWAAPPSRRSSPSASSTT
jgi:hypothetical protein